MSGDIMGSLNRCQVLLGLLVLLLRVLPVWTLNSNMTSLSSNSTLMVSDRLVSAPLGYFELGIFQIGNKYQLCIRYAAPIEQVVVWVANRDTPLSRNAYLHVNKTFGVLQLFDPAKDLDPNIPLWSTKINPGEVAYTATLNDTGNLELEDKNGKTLWESFYNDSITDTLLPEQEFRKEDNINLTSWLSSHDPATGHYTFSWGPPPNEELQLAYTSPKKFIPWQGGVYNPFINGSAPTTEASSPSLLYWDDKTGSVYSTVGAGLPFLSDPAGINSDYTKNTTLRRLTIDVDGGLRIWEFKLRNYSSWKPIQNWVVKKRDFQCFVIGTCGQFSKCVSASGDVSRVQCSCPIGFKPLYDNDTSRGCTHELPSIDCNATDPSQGVKYTFLNDTDFPWAGDFKTLVNINNSITCRDECLRDCNCAGAVYGQNNSEDRDKKFCWMKKGPLLNMGHPTAKLHNVDREAWIKTTHVLVPPQPSPEQPEEINWGLVVGLSVLGGVFVIAGAVVFCAYKRRSTLQETFCGGARAHGHGPKSPIFPGSPERRI